VDRRTNPYTPNAGAQPPFLVGRDRELEVFDVLLTRMENGLTQQSMIITGLRGVGKTVLLGAFREIADEHGWVALDTEITKNASFANRFARLARQALLRLSTADRWRDRARRAAGVLKSFSLTFDPHGSVAIGLDVGPLPGEADSGDLTEDLTDLLVALGEAAKESGRGVVFLFDELQYLRVDELEALITALHKTVQRNLPVTLVGAGLPQIPALAGEAKSYSERLFTFPRIGELTRADAVKALTVPAKERGVDYEAAAVEQIVEYTQGYPYFLQEYGSIVWDFSAASPITAIDALAAQPLVEEKLDESFFRVRIERASHVERQYMRAMAECGPGPHTAGEVAEKLGKTAQQAAPTRARLIEKGLLYAPAYGSAAFTVPQFDRYLLRTTLR
jgi:hypothetical protein